MDAAFWSPRTAFERNYVNYEEIEQGGGTRNLFLRFPPDCMLRPTYDLIENPTKATTAHPSFNDRGDRWEKRASPDRDYTLARRFCRRQ